MDITKVPLSHLILDLRNLLSQNVKPNPIDTLFPSHLHGTRLYSYATPPSCHAAPPLPQPDTIWRPAPLRSAPANLQQPCAGRRFAQAALRRWRARHRGRGRRAPWTQVWRGVWQSLCTCLCFKRRNTSVQFVHFQNLRLLFDDRGNPRAFVNGDSAGPNGGENRVISNRQPGQTESGM
jgi:hypothetical protein